MAAAKTAFGSGSSPIRVKIAAGVASGPKPRRAKAEPHASFRASAETLFTKLTLWCRSIDRLMDPGACQGQDVRRGLGRCETLRESAAVSELTVRAWVKGL